MSNVKKEFELYDPMCKWLKQYLQDKYKRETCDIIVEDTHAYTLDKILDKYGVINEYPQAVGLDIQIDVLGTVKRKKQTDLYFIEAKKNQLNLHDLGQLWAYCKLIDPAGAFLLSSKSMGSLDKVLVNLKRDDLLDFGDGKTIKQMHVAKWDVVRNTIDNASLVPKI